MPMASPPHPGRSLLRDCIEELGLTITEAAERLRIQERYLAEVCRCEAPITPLIAIRIDQAFGGGRRDMAGDAVRATTSGLTRRAVGGFRQIRLQLRESGDSGCGAAI